MNFRDQGRIDLGVYRVCEGQFSIKCTSPVFEYSSQVLQNHPFLEWLKYAQEYLVSYLQ